MLSYDDICLIAPLEQDKTVHAFDGTVYKRYFEEEAVRLAKSARNIKQMSSMDICFFNVNSSNVKKSTLHQLEDLGCKCIDVSKEDDKSYKEIGFLTKPLCGFYAEQLVKQQCLVNVDLDMMFMKALPLDLVASSETAVLIEQYSDDDAKLQRSSIGNFKPFDTCFIISRKQHRFYTHYYNLCHSAEILENPQWKSIQNQSGDYYLEEFVVDYLYSSKTLEIAPMTNHIFGEGYKELDKRSEKEFEDILFMHSPIHDSSFANIDNCKQLVKYLQYAKN